MSEMTKIAGEEVVSHVTYLGSEVDNNGGCERELLSQITQMTRNAIVKLNNM